MLGPSDWRLYSSSQLPAYLWRWSVRIRFFAGAAVAIYIHISTTYAPNMYAIIVLCLVSSCSPNFAGNATGWYHVLPNFALASFPFVLVVRLFVLLRPTRPTATNRKNQRSPTQMACIQHTPSPVPSVQQAVAEVDGDDDDNNSASHFE